MRLTVHSYIVARLIVGWAISQNCGSTCVRMGSNGFDRYILFIECL